MMEIVAVPAFSDNYIWLVHDPASGETAVVDPGDGAAALGGARQRGWAINQIWNTHWHPDHTGGNLAVKEATGAVVSGPAAEMIPGVDVQLREEGEVQLGGHRGRVIEIPGHTLGHIGLVFESAGVAFVGDTMFAMGCGRLFEGTPEQMHASLQRIAALPEAMRLYPGHEYTLANARFAIHAEPHNADTAERLRAVEAMRERGQITLPTTVAVEKATNPFVRAQSTDQFAQLRRDKDNFR